MLLIKREKKMDEGALCPSPVEKSWNLKAGHFACHWVSMSFNSPRII
jgi:hypothetical protein